MINASELPLPPMTRRWVSNCPINPIILNQESQSPLLNPKSAISDNNSSDPMSGQNSEVSPRILGPAGWLSEQLLRLESLLIAMHLNYGLIPIVSICARMDSAFGIQYWEPIWVTSELCHYITTCINHNFITFIIFQFYLLTLHRFVHSLTKWVKRFEPTRCNSGKVFFRIKPISLFPCLWSENACLYKESFEEKQWDI